MLSSVRQRPVEIIYCNSHLEWRGNGVGVWCSVVSCSVVQGKVVEWSAR